MIVAAANFTHRDVPITELLSARFKGIPCKLLNDADAAMAAEIWHPEFVGDVDRMNAVMITLGTGIGVSLVLKGEIYEGTHGLIEAGHMIVNKSGRRCGCGQIGCAEAYSSANNTALRMQEADMESRKVS